MDKAKQLRTFLAAAAAAAAGFTSAQAASPLVDAQWLGHRTVADSVVVVDLRQAKHYAEGHIPGAVNAPYGDFGWRETVDDVVGMLPPLATINERIGSLGITPASHVLLVPYGESARDVAGATRVFWTLKLLGHDKVSLLDGGMRSWESQHRFITERRVNAPRDAGPYPGRVDEQLVAYTDSLVERVESGHVLPIDSRIDDQWSGKTKHPKAILPGSLPGAQRLPLAELVDPDTGKIVTAKQVVEIAKNYGWEPGSDKPLVAYCNTGHTASTVWFALTYVANIPDVSLYDGSMVAWTRDADNPRINSPGRVEQFLSNVGG